MANNISANCFKAYLAGSLASSGSETTFYLTNITTLTGETIATANFALLGRGILTINPLSSTNIEFASFTGVDATNNTLTGCVRGLSALGETSSTTRMPYQPVSTPVIISFGVHNIQDLINIMADTSGPETISGLWSFTQSPLLPTPTTDSQAATKKYVDEAVVGLIGTATTTTFGTSKVSVTPATTTSTLNSYSESNQNADINVGNVVPMYGQSFTTATDKVIDSCKFYVKKSGSPTGNVFATIYNHTGTYGVNGKPIGAAIATSDLVDISTLTGSYALVTFSFSAINRINLVGGTNYFVVFNYDNIDAYSNYPILGAHTPSPSVTGNCAQYFSSNWFPQTAQALCFYVYGALANNPIVVGTNDNRVPPIDTSTMTAGEVAALPGNNTGIAVGAGNKYVTQTGLQHSAEQYAADAGASDAYAITLSPVPDSLTNGMVVKFKANTVNTTSCTLDVNSLGAKTIKKSYNVDLATGDIKAGQLVSVIYDGTNWQMLSPIANSFAGKFASGNVQYAMTTATGTQNIAHGLGATPVSFDIIATVDNSSTIAHAFNSNYCSSPSDVSAGRISGSGGFALGTSTSNYQSAAITADATNIIISWSKTGSPTGNAFLIWKAFV